ncbi:MAG: carboxypeptidase-like regulatory domain-containing protein [Armatimonadota bacterium]|nr:carboxypeptidase-like regulatory domain-containing protein [Armatimonadota bacterium]
MKTIKDGHRGLNFLGMIAASLLLTALALPVEAATGTIQGKVVNRTGGVRPVANVPVTLTSYVNEAEEQKKTTTTDTAGRFAFRGLPTGPGRSYVLQVKYKEGDYESPRFTLQGSETVKTVEMVVYEPTTDPSVVRAGMHHIIVDVQEGALQIVELVVLVNRTDRTYIGATTLPDGRRETLRFSLPGGARDVQYLDGLMECCVISKGNVLIDTMDVKPGTRQIAYGYVLPFTTSRVSFERPLDTPTDTLEFLVPDIGVTVQSAQLAEKGVLETSSGRYLRYSGTRLASGERITIAIEGLPTKTRSFRALAFALALAILSAVLVYPLIKRRPQAEKAPMWAEEKRLALLREIAELDDRFEAGELPEEEYRTLRAQWKAELLALSRNARSGMSHNPRKEGER